MAPFGTKQISKAKSGAKQAAKKAQRAAPGTGTAKKQASKAASSAGSQVRKVANAAASAGQRLGGVGYRKFEGDALWLPNTERPPHLDGSLPGDRGFDPLGLSKPSEYVQYSVDSLDQNKAQNKMGQFERQIKRNTRAPEVSGNSLAPYSEVFSLQRFRENELIHGRWAMLACLGCIWAELQTGVSWVEAGKVELDGAQYAGFSLPFDIWQLIWIEALAVGGAEIYRNREQDPDKRCYPGGYFDPLGLASDEKADRLKESEIKHGRLAMIAFLGYGVQALIFGEGVLGSLARAT